MARLSLFHLVVNLQYNLLMARKKTTLSKAMPILLMMVNIMPKLVAEKSFKLQQEQMVQFLVLS